VAQTRSRERLPEIGSALPGELLRGRRRCGDPAVPILLA